MNITLRKLTMLEKSLAEKEEQAKFEGWSTCPIDKDLQRRINYLLEKVRV